MHTGMCISPSLFCLFFSPSCSLLTVYEHHAHGTMKLKRNAPLDAPHGVTIQLFSSLNARQSRDAVVIDKLLSLEKKLFKKSESWGPMLEKEIARRNTWTLIAFFHDNDNGDNDNGTTNNSQTATTTKQHQEILGYLLCTATSSLVCHISKLVVVPHARRQGIGRALATAAIFLSKTERKAGSITLHVASDNHPAVSLYKSLGFDCNEDEDGVLKVCTIVCLILMYRHSYAWHTFFRYIGLLCSWETCVQDAIGVEQ